MGAEVGGTVVHLAETAAAARGAAAWAAGMEPPRICRSILKMGRQTTGGPRCRRTPVLNGKAGSWPSIRFRRKVAVVSVASFFLVALVLHRPQSLRRAAEPPARLAPPWISLQPTAVSSEGGLADKSLYEDLYLGTRFASQQGTLSYKLHVSTLGACINQRPGAHNTSGHTSDVSRGHPSLLITRPPTALRRRGRPRALQQRVRLGPGARAPTARPAATLP